jgi:hypothetical protein
VGLKGATIIEVTDARVAAITARTLDVVRWCVCGVDATDAQSAEDCIDLARPALSAAVAEADGRTVAARVSIHGASGAHSSLAADPERWENELRSVASELADELWLERVSIGTSAQLDVASLARRDDAIGQVARALRDLSADPEARGALLSELADLRTKLPPEVREGTDGVRLDDPEFLAAVLSDVEQMLLPTLAAIGSDE